MTNAFALIIEVLEPVWAEWNQALAKNANQGFQEVSSEVQLFLNNESGISIVRF